MSYAPPHHRSPHPSHDHRNNNNNSNSKRYVPKTSSSSSSSSKQPQPPLTTALRVSSSSSSVDSSSAGAGNFVSYLPQDEAVAAGLGGLDTVESQSVVDLLNDELSALLRLKPREFWREVARNTSLHVFLDSYLQFRHRWYDLPHRAPQGTVASVVVGETELSRRVFMILYRISSNKDPGAASSDSLSMKDHTALLQEKKLLELPKLLDICAIYGHDNGELTGLLVANAIKARKVILDDISSVAYQFLNIVHIMHERCVSSLQVLSSSGRHDNHGYGQLHKEFLDVLDFINDAIVTQDAFLEAYRPAALPFCASFEMSYGIDELLNTLARLHDSLLPSLLQGFKTISRLIGTNGKKLPDVNLSIKILSKRSVKFGWGLLEYCYLNDLLAKTDVQATATANIIPAKVEDPLIRGEILLQKLKDLHGESNYAFHENIGNNSLTFLQRLETDFEILARISSLRTNGWIYMEEDQFQYILQVTASSFSSQKTEAQQPHPPINYHSLNNDQPQKDEESIILESKISQIKDLFPDYGKGFLAACLVVYNQNPEEVIQHILEGTLHKDLLSLDTSLEEIQVQPVKPKPMADKKDKGKGLLLQESEDSSEPQRSTLNDKGRIVNNPSPSSSSSVSSSLYGRYARKSDNSNLSYSTVLDTKSGKEKVLSAVLAGDFDYEDEYDDSFDDLGLSVVGSGYEETEKIDNDNNSNNNINNASVSNSNPRWGSKKKNGPQFYVKDGKNYSYKVADSVPVWNAKEASLVNQAQRELIHGLGRGGNLPLGAVKELTGGSEEGNNDDNEGSGSGDNGFGRGNGNSSSRGRGRGGRNHYRKDRALKKHFAGLRG